MGTLLSWQVKQLLGDETRCQEIEAEIRRRFQGSEYFHLRRVSCRLRDGRLMLSGRLPSYLIKQATSIVREVLLTSVQTFSDLDSSIPPIQHYAEMAR